MKIKPRFSKLSVALLSFSVLLFIGFLALTLVAPKTSFKNIDLTGNTSFGKDFVLQDPAGNTRTLGDYKGKAVVIFFGYTQCPDVCPTTLSELKAVMTQLGPLANKVQVIFITVDPERDTAEILGQYVPAFDSRFVGLRPADKAALQKVTKDFKIYYNYIPGQSKGSYTVDHSAGGFVFDPEGQLRLYVKYAQGPEPLAHDLKVLLQ